MADVETPRVRLVVVDASSVGETQAAAFDPYCQAQCGDVILRTAAQAKTTSPTWAQNFTFGVKKPLGDAVRFKVFGLNERGRDVLLGSASLTIDILTPDTHTTHHLTLEDAEGQKCGQLTVEATYEPKFMAPPRKEDGGIPKKMPTSPKKSPVSPQQGDMMATPSDEKPAEESDAVTSPAAEVDAEAPQPPNFFVVTVLEALGLLPCDGSGMEATSDPYVRISCTNNQSQRTKTQQQTLHPSWRQRFYFSLLPAQKQLLELNVEDSDLLTSDFMGRCVIDLDEFVKRSFGEKQTFWLALEQQSEGKDKDTPSDLSPQRKMNYGNGKICIAIERQYLDRDISTLEQGEFDNVTEVQSGRGLHGPGGSDEVEDDGGNDGNLAEDTNEEINDGGGDDDADAKQAEVEARRKQREEERQKMLAELSDVQFLSGDYQVRVRIIEVRDLQPKDLNGLCDPVISVECLGQCQHTVVKQKQLSCVFDEYLYFDFKNLDKDTVQQGSIKISVLDADGPGSLANRSAISRSFDDLVGFFSVDIPYVYYQPDHELKRKWVALVGSGTTNSDSIQGYVLLSLVVLGPNDKMKLHDAAEDRDPDEHLVKSKADINSMVLVPPRVTQKLSFLVVTIYRVEELPDMDYSMMMHGGIDGYVRAYFAGQDVLETKKNTAKGSENLTTIFNQELWFPVLLPTMSDNIFLSMWDWDMTTADQLVANTLRPFSFKQVQHYPNQFKHVWANLYGPPVGYDTDTSALRLMQNHPAHASTYRGRLLMSLRVEDGLQSVNDEAHVRNLLNTSIAPRMRQYTLRTALFYGTEIPVFASKTHWNRNARMSLKISVGCHSIESSRADNLSGICHFNQYIDIVDVELPEDLDQVPDVFVHLVRHTMNETRCICFARFSAKDLFCQDPEARKNIPAPHWVVLYEDKVLDDLQDPDFTGNVLINLRLEDADQKTRKEEQVTQQWRHYASTTVQYMKYVIFVHVFQGKCLPSADYDGLLDPYVKVVCIGSEGQVSTRMSSRDPCYYHVDDCYSSEHSTDTYRPVGKFKGIVRVLRSRDEPPLFDLDQFLNPQPYLVRVYVLDALNLHPKDSNNRCDPYLRVSLGDGRRREQLFNDRNNYQTETLTPKFHKMYEFKADLPGASELKLEVLDYDFFAIPTLPTGLSKALSTAVGTTVDGDDFVGATLIDLEDRWFDARWQELGLSPERPERRKPLEVRPLFAPSSTLPQGSLRLWVDILTGTEMNVVRPLDISLPPPQMFEVRVIVYKAKNVTAGDFTDLSDLFVKSWLQNRDDKSQSTDTHWRARSGRASFNWRMKFDVELPLDPEKEADRGHLHFQMWDRDVVYDDCLADAVVDLTSFLKTAFKTKQTVNVFAKPKPIRIRGSESMAYEDSSRRSGYSAVEDATSATRLRSPRSGEIAISIIEEEERDYARKPLLSEQGVDFDDETETESENVDADMENAESLVKSFMHRLGMGDDPEDASWLTLTTRDSRTGDRVRAGELLISVEILPKHLAEVRSAGLGRGEPNNFPFLPEPADRLHLSAMWNPCYVLEALMGPKYYRAFASFFLCTVFVLLVLFAGPLINVLLQLFELIPEPFGLIAFFVVLGGFIGTLVYLLHRCRRAIIRVSGGGADLKSSTTKSKRKARRTLR